MKSPLENREVRLRGLSVTGGCHATGGHPRGHMIRWLAPGGAVSGESPEFRANSDQLMGLGADLLQLAAGLPRAGG